MRPHSAYRDSGVEWLGELPQHWVVRPFRYVCRLAYGDSLASEVREFGDVPVFGSNGVVGRHCTPNTLAPVIVVGRKGSHGEVNFSETEAFAIDTTYFVDQRHTASVLRWLYYILKSADLGDVSKDSAVPGLSREDAYEKRLPLPPLDEQRDIAAFLDRETERIDSLIAKKRLLIERLQEYRTALITRTVTRGLPPEAARAAGLDPSPRLKPSGVEWLGDVPEHWDVSRLKYAVSTNDEALSDREDPYQSISYVDIGSVDSERGITEIEEMNFEDAPSRARRLVRDGDTIVSTVRTYLRAIASIVTPPPTMVVSTGFAVIRPRDIDPGFSTWMLRSNGVVEEIVARSVGVSYPAINACEIGNIPVAIPPLDEQQEIASFLEREGNRVDKLARQTDTAIERLKEYRTALISAAVTGEIDVRKTASSDRDSVELQP